MDRSPGPGVVRARKIPRHVYTSWDGSNPMFLFSWENSASPIIRILFVFTPFQPQILRSSILSAGDHILCLGKRAGACWLYFGLHWQ